MHWILKRYILYHFYFIKYLDYYLSLQDDDTRMTILTIIKEELSDDIIFNIGCPRKPLDIILYNLCSFLGLDMYLQYSWLLSLEIKYNIIQLIINNEIKTMDFIIKLKNFY